MFFFSPNHDCLLNLNMFVSETTWLGYPKLFGYGQNRVRETTLFGVGTKTTWLGLLTKKTQLGIGTKLVLRLGTTMTLLGLGTKGFSNMRYVISETS